MSPGHQWRAARRVWRAAGTVPSLAVLCVLAGCPGGEASDTLLPSGVAPGGLPDSVAPGQLAEGGEQIYGLVLPRDMRVLARRDDVSYARGTLPFEAMANYVRARVIAKRIETGPARTVFVDAALRSNPKYVIQIEVRRKVGGVELVLRNRTRKRAAEGLSPADRWRKAGMTPDGKRADPRAE